MAKYREQMKKYYFDPTKYPTYLDQLGIKYPTVRAKSAIPMPRLHDSRDRAAIQARVRVLRPDTERRWGKMSVGQMLWHVNEANGSGLGRVQLAPAKTPLPRSLYEVHRLNMPWPRGAPTLPSWVPPTRTTTSSPNATAASGSSMRSPPRRLDDAGLPARPWAHERQRSQPTPRQAPQSSSDAVRCLERDRLRHLEENA